MKQKIEESLKNYVKQVKKELNSEFKIVVPFQCFLGEEDHEDNLATES